MTLESHPPPALHYEAVAQVRVAELESELSEKKEALRAAAEVGKLILRKNESLVKVKLLCNITWLVQARRLEWLPRVLTNVVVQLAPGSRQLEGCPSEP